MPQRIVMAKLSSSSLASNGESVEHPTYRPTIGVELKMIKATAPERRSAIRAALAT